MTDEEKDKLLFFGIVILIIGFPLLGYAAWILFVRYFL